MTDDDNIAAKIEDKETKTRTALNAASAQVAGLVSVLDHGAVMDGATDDTAAIQAAAEAALAAGSTLYLPPGTTRLASRVEVAVSVRCDALIRIDAASTGEVRVVRALAPVAITSTRLTGLTESSGVVGGLGGSMGDLYLTSTEHLIERNNGTTGQFYAKSEVSKIVSTAGAVSPPVKTTYDSTATVTAAVYPPEAALTLTGLRFTVDGTTGTHPDAVLSIFRSDVTVNDLVATNASTSSTSLTNAVVVRQATRVEFNRPRIHGFSLDGAGYGIARYNTADVRINDGQVTGCRHAVSGLWNKDTHINRGTYEGGLDDHWCWGFYLNDVQSVVTAGRSHVQVAGADAVATGGTFTGGRNVMAIRADTPELAGSFVLQGDWAWAPGPSEGSRWVMGYSTSSLSAFAYGRTLRSPTRAAVTDGDLRVPTGALSSIINTYGANFNHDHWQVLDVARVRISPGALVIAVWADRNAAVHPGAAYGPTINVTEMAFRAATDSLLIYDSGAGTGPTVAVNAAGCTDLYLKLPETGLGRVQVDGCHVKRLFRTTVATTPTVGDIAFRNCELDGMAFNGVHYADFTNNVWKNASTSTSIAMDLRVKSYRGNLHASGSTGHPSHPDGYRNTTYYKDA